MNEMNTPSTPPPPPPAPASNPIPAPPVAYAPAPGYRKSPALAGVLSALPGVGHVYLGLYQRAAVFFGVFVLLQALCQHAHSRRAAPIGLLIGFWWFFVLIDAVRQAHSINRSGAPDSNLVAGEKTFRPIGGLGIGIFLILVGAYFLLDRLVSIDLSFLFDWWPLLLIAFGAWQVFSYYKAKERAEAGASASDAEKF